MIQQNIQGSTLFHKSWLEFKIGFLVHSNNYLFGNENLYILTNISCSCRSRLEVCHPTPTNASKNLVTCYVADYTLFSVSSEADGYRLRLGTMSGTAGNSMSEQKNRIFSTVHK